MKIDINNPIIKNVLKWGGVAVAGVIAVANAISDQQKEAELKEMKDFIKTLKAEKES